MRNPIKLWNREGVRGIGPAMKNRDGWYIRFTPNFGFSFMLRPVGLDARKLRFARHHGLQIATWRHGTERWVVERQLLGRSTVKGEKHLVEGS